MKTAGDTLALWEEVKRQEKHQETYTDAMNGVAKSLPALIYAEKIQSRAKRSGFDWPTVQGGLDKLREETCELEQAIAQNGSVEDELGDVLFAAVNVSRKLSVDPERALVGAAKKFMTRFAAMERMAGDKLSDLSLTEMEALWQRAKEETKQA